MTACILHPDDEHPPEPGWSCCWRARDRMAAALRDIPLLVVELSGLGYVERDVRPGRRVAAVAYRIDTRERYLIYEDGPADPVAGVLTAGPVNGARNGPRVMSSGERSLPIRIDPTDLLAPARPASIGVKTRGGWSAVPGGDPDQVGHLAVATELEFWARDWADARGESCPMPTVPVLAAWLLDRLDWACQHHPALDEFAGKLTHLRTVLTAATGRLPARPQPVDRPCPSCGLWSLYHAPDGRYIECGACNRALTDDEYREHLEDIIKTDWNRYEPGSSEWTAPRSDGPVWARNDEVGRVTIARFDGFTWWSWSGAHLDEVSYWAEIHYPADPGPAKEDAA